MTNPVSGFILKYFYYLFLGLLAVTIFQRKYKQEGKKKRSAIIYLGMIAFACYAFAVLLHQFSLSDLWFIPFFIALGVFVFFFKARILPFAFRCIQCKKQLTFDRVAFIDSNLCEACSAPPPQSEPEQPPT